jgi:hypothetical protein
MSTSFISSLDALSQWRGALLERLDELSKFLSEHNLADASGEQSLAMVRERLSSEKLIVAFVAEFSRGKSELINAIFFADAGRRVLPATPGRTTMCPVEMAWDAQEQPTLALLPIESRLEGLSLGELRLRQSEWTHFPLEVQNAEALAKTLLEVTSTQLVACERARALGFWDDARPQDNPPINANGLVEIPSWRHALINYPHPLLKQGLVVMDTPGLNAIGAEPELTLGLLPSAHAIVFILGADTGVTKSDLEIWRDHLGASVTSRFVVLNKIDALIDPLASPEEIDAHIARQCKETARTLEIDTARVFPLSARQALAARIQRNGPALIQSRLPALEAALGNELLPQRQDVLAQVAIDGAQQAETTVSRHLSDARRQVAEQMLELRGLRGKSSGKLRLMLQRVEAESGEFEQCTTRLQALRMVHSRMLKDALVGISTDRLREEVTQMQDTMRASLLNLGARKAFISMCARLRSLIQSAQQRSSEIRDMLHASFSRLNAEFGFSLVVGKAPDIARFEAELDLIERSYVQYLGLTQALRLGQPAFMEQFRRMLISKLRVVFENASSDLELWNKTASSQVDAQLRDRRKTFKRRREAMERIQSAANELEQRITEIESQDQRLQHFLARSLQLTGSLRQQASQTEVIPRELLQSLPVAENTKMDLDLDLGPAPVSTAASSASASAQATSPAADWQATVIAEHSLN